MKEIAKAAVNLVRWGGGGSGGGGAAVVVVEVLSYSCYNSCGTSSDYCSGRVSSSRRSR